MGFKCDFNQRYTVCTSPRRWWCYMFSGSIVDEQQVNFQFTTFDLILGVKGRHGLRGFTDADM